MDQLYNMLSLYVPLITFKSLKKKTVQYIKILWDQLHYQENTESIIPYSSLSINLYSGKSQWFMLIDFDELGLQIYTI